MTIEEAANHYASVTDQEAHGIDFIREVFIAGAEWQKEQFEKNRLAACDKMTKEEFKREMDFADEIILKEHRQPTFSDAINYGMRLQKEQDEKEQADLFTIVALDAAQRAKKQMMNEAEECELYWDGDFLAIDLNMAALGYSERDKVRVIVLPKED